MYLTLKDKIMTLTQYAELAGSLHLCIPSKLLLKVLLFFLLLFCCYYDLVYIPEDPKWDHFLM